MLHTTRRLLRQYDACEEGYITAIAAMKKRGNTGQDDLIPLTFILESNGIEDALWALCAVPEDEEAERDKTARLLACDFAENVAHLWVAPEGITWKPADTISIARRFANGEATPKELDAAWAAAWAAAWDAAWDAARDAAWAAARAAARDAAWAAARAAARDAAWAAAWDAQQELQAQQFIARVTGPTKGD